MFKKADKTLYRYSGLLMVIAFYVLVVLAMGACGKKQAKDMEEKPTTVYDTTDWVEASQTPLPGSEEASFRNFGRDAEPEDVEKIEKGIPEGGASVITRDAVDFDALIKQDPDVIAYISIPGTNISYPVCQHLLDDAYYLYHNDKGELDINGALYTESTYNNKDFSDPVTVVYGHNMRSGKMFGYLQETFSQGFKGHDEAIVYMPDGENHYQIFAAMPVDSNHLLNGKDFTDPAVFRKFTESILQNRSIEAVIDKSVEIGDDDKLLIMSTCIGGQPDRRYIVAGKKVR